MCFDVISDTLKLGSVPLPRSHVWFSSDSMLSLLEPTLVGAYHFRRASLLAFLTTLRKADLRASEVSWLVPAATTEEVVVVWSDFFLFMKSTSFSTSNLVAYTLSVLSLLSNSDYVKDEMLI